MISDELTDDAAGTGMTAEQQRLLVEQYCASTLERLSSAHTREEWRRIAEERCSEFEQQCLSSVLRSAVRSRIEAMIEEHWRDQ